MAHMICPEAAKYDFFKKKVSSPLGCKVILPDIKLV